MTFTAQLGTKDSMPGNIALGRAPRQGKLKVWRTAWGNPNAYTETWGVLPRKEYKEPST